VAPSEKLITASPFLLKYKQKSQIIVEDGNPQTMLPPPLEWLCYNYHTAHVLLWCQFTKTQKREISFPTNEDTKRVFLRQKKLFFKVKNLFFYVKK
jgi:hypothetical protein